MNNETALPVPDKQQHPRRQVIVDKAFQMQYILIWFWVGIGILTTIFLFYLVVVRLYAHNPVVQPMMTRVMLGLGLCVATFCSLIGVITTKLTHRVAGAALNLQRAVDRLQRNKLDDAIRLRPDDYLQGLSKQLDEFRLALRERREATLAALQAVSDAQAALPEDARARLEPALARLRATADVVDHSGAAHPAVAQK